MNECSTFEEYINALWRTIEWTATALYKPVKSWRQWTWTLIADSAWQNILLLVDWQSRKSSERK